MTTDLTAKILDMLDAGMPPAHIAWELRCSADDVHLAAGHLPRAELPTPTALAPGHWSETEDAIVEEMRLRCLEPREIRQVLIAEGYRRPTRSISLRMRKLADCGRASETRRRPLR